MTHVQHTESQSETVRNNGEVEACAKVVEHGSKWYSYSYKLIDNLKVYIFFLNLNRNLGFKQVLFECVKF